MIDSLISVVIPIYNVEKYLDRCINSVLNQTYKNLEIILIDDGSPDNCPQMCNEYAAKDKRIKVIHKRNEGLGYARNTGIKESCGEYIIFIDSDDFIDKNCIKDSYELAKENDADIVVFGHYVYENGTIKVEKHPVINEQYSNKEIIQNKILPAMIEGNKGLMDLSAWGKMYSMNLIRNSDWLFCSEREYISEDYYSLLNLFKYINKICFSSNAYYYYCLNSNSLSTSFKENRYYEICKCNMAMVKNSESFFYSENIVASLKIQFIYSTIGALKLIIKSNLKKNKKIEEIKLIMNDQYLARNINDINLKGENISIKLLIFMMKKKLYFIIYLLFKVRYKS